jgi:hypothetical protein
MRKLISTLFLAILLAAPILTLAANPPDGGGNPPDGGGSGTTLINPLKGGTDLKSFLLSIIDLIIRIGAIIVVLMIVFVGFKFVTARGEPGAITEAKKALLWTLVGALVLLGSKAIALAIEATVAALQ